MNNVTIQINKLGAVKNAQIELKPLMLFTGKSGLGKSYVAFLAHYVYVLLSTNRLKHFFDGLDFSVLLSDAKSGDTILTISTESLFSWINSDAISYIRYMVGHDKLEGDVIINWPYKEQYIEFTYTAELEGLANDEEIMYSIGAENFVYNKISSQSKIDAEVFRKLLQAILIRDIFDDYIRFSSYVLPPSRGALLELSECPVFRSGMYESFFDLKNDLTRPLKLQKKEDDLLETLLNRVNNGKVNQNEGQFIFTTEDGIPMPLTAAASSVKELAPFTMLLKKFHLNQCSILFEEPEAHLHPQRQQSVADLIGYALNMGAFIQITTHSDYFIKRLNLLIRLFELKDKYDEQAIDNLLSDVGIERKTLLSPSIINAYYLSRESDGSTAVRQFDIKMENMIPFDSFIDTIIEDFKNSEIIDKFESPEDNND